MDIFLALCKNSALWFHVHKAWALIKSYEVMKVLFHFFLFFRLFPPVLCGVVGGEALHSHHDHTQPVLVVPAASTLGRLLENARGGEGFLHVGGVGERHDSVASQVEPRPRRGRFRKEKVEICREDACNSKKSLSKNKNAECTNGNQRVYSFLLSRTVPLKLLSGTQVSNALSRQQETFQGRDLSEIRLKASKIQLCMYKTDEIGLF